MKFGTHKRAISTYFCVIYLRWHGFCKTVLKKKFVWTTVVLYCRVLLLEHRKINGKKRILYPRILKSADINTPRIHTGCFGYLLNGNSSLFGHEPQTRKNHQTCIKCSEHIGGYTNHSVFAENRYQRRDKVIFLRYWRGLFSQLTCSSFMLLLLGISFSYFADISKPDIKREDRLVPTSEALVPGRINLHKSGREKKGQSSFFVEFATAVATETVF